MIVVAIIIGDPSWRALRRKASTLYVVGGESLDNLTAATDPNNFL